MAGVKFIGLPASFAIRAVRELSKRLFIGIARAVDICARQAKFGLQTERLLEAFNRLRHPVLADPLQILWRRIGRRWIRCDAPAVPCLDAIQQSLTLGRRYQIDQSLPASGYEGIKVDQAADQPPWARTTIAKLSSLIYVARSASQRSCTVPKLQEQFVVALDTCFWPDDHGPGGAKGPSWTLVVAVEP